MKNIPLLLTDFMRLIEKLPDPGIWQGPSEISLPIKDSITKLDRHILFIKREAFIDVDDTEPTPFWTCNQHLAIDQKLWKTNRKGK